MAAVKVKGRLAARTTKEYCHGHVVCFVCLVQAELKHEKSTPCYLHSKVPIVYPGPAGIHDVTEVNQGIFSKGIWTCSTCNHRLSFCVGKATHFGVRCDSEECSELRIGSSEGPHPRLMDHLHEFAACSLMDSGAYVTLMDPDTLDEWVLIGEASRKLCLLQSIKHLGKGDYAKMAEQNRFDWGETLNDFSKGQRAYIGYDRYMWPPRARRGLERACSLTKKAYRIDNNSGENDMRELLNTEWDFVQTVEAKLEEATHWKRDNRGKGVEEVELSSIDNATVVIAPVPMGSLVAFEAMRMFTFACAASLGLFAANPDIAPIASSVAEIFDDDPGHRADGESALFEHAKYFANDHLGCWKSVTTDIDHQNDIHFETFHEQLGLSEGNSVTWFPVEVNREPLLLEKTSLLDMSRSLVSIWAELIQQALHESAKKGNMSSWAYRLGAEILPELHRQLSILFTIRTHESPNYQGLYVEPLYLEKKQVLGEGRFGKVYEVRNGSVRLALKEVDLSVHGEPGQVVDSEQNIATMGHGYSQMVHHSLIRHYTPCTCWVNIASNKLFILMPAYERNLHTFKEDSQLSFPLDDGFSDARIVKHRMMCAFIMYQVCHQLDGIHSRNYIHGDLHAGNVLLSQDHEAAAVDFGLSYRRNPDFYDAVDNVDEFFQTTKQASGGNTENSVCSGSYISSQSGGKKSDMHSLATLYEHLLGGIDSEKRKDEMPIIARWRSEDYCRDNEAELSQTDLKKIIFKCAVQFIWYQGGGQFCDIIPLWIRTTFHSDGVSIGQMMDLSREELKTMMTKHDLL